MMQSKQLDNFDTVTQAIDLLSRAKIHLRSISEASYLVADISRFMMRPMQVQDNIFQVMVKNPFSKGVSWALGIETSRLLVLADRLHSSLVQDDDLSAMLDPLRAKNQFCRILTRATADCTNANELALITWIWTRACEQIGRDPISVIRATVNHSIY